MAPGAPAGNPAASPGCRDRAFHRGRHAGRRREGTAPAAGCAVGAPTVTLLEGRDAVVAAARTSAVPLFMLDGGSVMRNVQQPVAPNDDLDLPAVPPEAAPIPPRAALPEVAPHRERRQASTRARARRALTKAVRQRKHGKESREARARRRARQLLRQQRRERHSA